MKTEQDKTSITESDEQVTRKRELILAVPVESASL